MFQIYEMARPWIRERLREIGKSQTDLAKTMGLEPPRVSEMIAGSRGISPEEIVMIAEFLELPYMEVLARVAERELKAERFLTAAQADLAANTAGAILDLCRQGKLAPGGAEFANWLRMNLIEMARERTAEISPYAIKLILKSEIERLKAGRQRSRS